MTFQETILICTNMIILQDLIIDKLDRYLLINGTSCTIIDSNVHSTL